MIKEKFSKKEWEIKIISLAEVDASFRKLLRSNPQEALKKVGCPLFGQIKVNVIEEKEDSFTLVLPNMPSETQQLREEELTTISGDGPSVYRHPSCAGPANC